MKIGIDAISAIGRSGNSTYTRELMKALGALDTDNQYYLFSFLHDLGRKTPLSNIGIRWHEVHPYISRTLLPLNRIDVINDALVRLVARVQGIELFHFTNPLNFVAGPYKTVVTVHDLAPLRDSSWSKQSLNKLFAKKIKEIARHADTIIAVSEFTKKEIIETLHVPEERVVCIYEAASSTYYPDADRAAIQPTFGVGEYVLYAGQLQPRKNALNVVRAWGVLAKKYPQYKLILVGNARDEEYLTKLRDAAHEAHIEDLVVFAGSVDETLLRKLYSSTRVFVYPSFFEGFGLPPLEAMQCGTPVITSNTSSLPEVVGEAGLLIDPNNIAEMAEAIERVISDDALYTRLKTLALTQAAKFNWQKAAEETLQVYKSLP